MSGSGNASDYDETTLHGYLQEDLVTLQQADNNYTASSNSPLTANYAEWLFCFAMTAIFLAFSVYLLIAMIFYQVQIRSTKKNINSRPGSERKGGSSKFIDGLLILCTVSSIVRLIFDFWIEVSCVFSMTLNIALAAMCFACCYIMLWRRQRLLYAHKLMKYLASPVIKALSWVTLVILIISIILNCVFFVILGINYGTTERYKCEFGESNKWYTIKWIVLASTTVTFQSILLVLFIYPLCDHEKKMQIANVQRPAMPLQSLLRRVLVTAIICMFSDILMAVLSSVIIRPTGEIYSLAYTIDIAINIVSIICSFSDWRYRLMPFQKPM
ncbi:uncharacterized protein LOC144425127 [Styela clava]